MGRRQKELKTSHPITINFLKKMKYSRVESADYIETAYRRGWNTALEEIEKRIGIFMRIKVEKTNRPINRIEILGENIASFEMKNNWEVSEIYFKDDVPAARLEEIFIVLRKNNKKLH